MFAEIFKNKRSLRLFNDTTEYRWAECHLMQNFKDTDAHFLKMNFSFKVISCSLEKLLCSWKLTLTTSIFEMFKSLLCCVVTILLHAWMHLLLSYLWCRICITMIGDCVLNMNWIVICKRKWWSGHGLNSVPCWMLLLLMHLHHENHGVKSRGLRTCVANSINDESNIYN